MYCLFAWFTETGMGEASTYLLDLTVAASLLVIPSPGRRSTRLARPSIQLDPAVSAQRNYEISGVELQDGLELGATVAGTFPHNRRGRLLVSKAGGVPPQNGVGPTPNETPANHVWQVQLR